jgi:integrase
MLWYEFTDWMRAQRGTMNSTLANYRLPVTALLQDLGTDTRVFTAEKLRQFLQQQVKQSSQAQSKNLVTALRMFLRFLISRGDCPTGMDYAIPTVAGWRLEVLPKYLPAHDVERLIHSCDPVSTLGARDQAIPRRRNSIMRPVTPSDKSSRYSTKRLSISAAAFLSGSSARYPAINGRNSCDSVQTGSSICSKRLAI